MPAEMRSLMKSKKPCYGFLLHFLSEKQIWDLALHGKGINHSERIQVASEIGRVFSGVEYKGCKETIKSMCLLLVPQFQELLR